MAGLMVFSLYLMIILVITFFSREDGSRNRAMDLELFSTWGINTRNNAFVVENVLLFIPYGFACPWAFPWLRGFFRNIFAAFVTSLGVETFQLITGRGYFQIDDIQMCIRDRIRRSRTPCNGVSVSFRRAAV